ncbi:uncharacterized protein F5891DRAFT_1130927 [Suillus fuscotomentosus]|uniref:DNA 3'-5' helicase n=1 Tax=Suillus fuscotomentosus TaxID=1912939 RepID=A0AAD4DV71_9AGAM|nr:uncharacterized protein F5891DRAFT_1130927 [Suillus fuscotomentosus]KAG1894505.1 hypothetical protein F5891DRAFT_1130927 [Suillus fuscotomentosus]
MARPHYSIDIPSIESIQQTAENLFGYKPCLWQTLNFWLPLLFNGDGIMVLITPLNILGDKNYNELKEIGINTINLTMSTATADAYQEIKSLKYRKFIEKLFVITLDKSHCISEWGDSFRPEYGDIGNLRWILPAHIPFHITSATMPPHILQDVKKKLQIRCDADSFMVFANSRKETESVAQFLRSYVAKEYCDKIVWFHSGMSAKFRREAIENLWTIKIWGICCTDAAGMVCDCLKN